MASDAQQIVQKPPKKKHVQQKEIEKEIEEVVYSTIVIPTETRSGRIHYKISSSSVTFDTHVKKRKLRNMIISSERKMDQSSLFWEFMKNNDKFWIYYGS